LLFLAIFSAAAAWMIVFYLIRLQIGLRQRYPSDAPQRFHLNETPRLGGVGIALASTLAWNLILAVSVQGSRFGIPIAAAQVVAWCAISWIAFLTGLAEDLTHRFAARNRLALTLVAGAMACWLLDLSIHRLGIAPLDEFLKDHTWIGIALAMLAVGGLPHSFNIIDGYNGLAATVAMIILGALIYLCLLMGDRSLAGLLVCVAGATAGFLFWNYPKGLIFAGDGGAYFWGAVIALGSVLLVQRHPLISPWAVMLLLIYPVWETVFSIYRKLRRGISPGMADSLHFHQLVYKRLVRGVFHDDATRQMLMRNNRTSPYLWVFCTLSVIPAVLFWYSTPILMLFCLLFVLLYLASYWMMVRFKVPRWLKSSRHRPK
jgi:UDP-GlcNAc:undecaprenyl-phosphate/decaprenyl-phosphate GlcNAc-1-phosphate transferase